RKKRAVYPSLHVCQALGPRSRIVLHSQGMYPPAYDALYEQSVTEMDPEKRRQLFIQMNELLTEDVAVIPLIQVYTPVGASVSLTGLDITPWDLEIWNIADWRRE
ncbi:MAG TPA: hypothetical protein VMT34_15990, partial [Aggregatilineales bacterium]|nr:hypothetical protein [Aggregatilineales bacterium]